MDLSSNSLFPKNTIRLLLKKLSCIKSIKCIYNTLFEDIIAVPKSDLSEAGLGILSNTYLTFIRLSLVVEVIILIFKLFQEFLEKTPIIILKDFHGIIR